tara:strand:- start:96 stop:941 length:846 start_codon:yes stop_codon:yes gene_type:complete
MPAPLLAMIPTVAAYIARTGITKAVKKYGKKLVNRAMTAEKKVSGVAGSKKELKELPSKIKPTDKRVKGVKGKSKSATTRKRNQNVASNKAATDSAKAANVRSGRMRIGTAVGSTAGIEGASKLGRMLDDKISDKPTSSKSTRPFNMTAPENLKPKKTTSPFNMTAPENLKPKKTKIATDVPTPPKKKVYNTLRSARAAGADTYTDAKGNKKAAVLDTDLKEGQSLTDYLNSKKRAKKAQLMSKPAKLKMMSGGMTKKYRDGGPVRGAGMAKKGVRACKMR